jgi:hypothetical protein
MSESNSAVSKISAARLLYPLKPDIGWRGWHGRKVPKAAVSNCNKEPRLFDHLVGAGEQGWL